MFSASFSLLYFVDTLPYILTSSHMNRFVTLFLICRDSSEKLMVSYTNTHNLNLKDFFSYLKNDFSWTGIAVE
jgi:hypothetical protein